jgi:Ca-activated chloride channel family protein
VKRQQATVVVVLDVSGSMAAGDLQPSRLAAAKATAYRLVNALPHGYRASVVIFSDHSAVIAPPTDDLDSIRAAIARAHTGPQGTALGDAVYHAVDVARRVPAQSNGKRPPASVVVLSDGGLTAGRVTPQQAAKRAAGSRVPVFAVAFGTPQGIVRQQLQGGFEEQIQVPVSDTVLQQFAHWTGGRLWTSRRSSTRGWSTGTSMRVQGRSARPWRSPRWRPAAGSRSCSPVPRSRASGSGG